MNDDQPPSIAAGEHPLGPRQLLEALLVDPCSRSNNHEVEEHEILQLAQNHPDVFAADIVRKREGAEEARRCPLNCLMARRQPCVAIKTFKAVYDAFPAAIHSVDSFGDTVLLELTRHADHSDEWFELLKAVISTSNAELAVEDRQGNTPIMKVISTQCSSQEIVQYMIAQHPGDPFRDHTSRQKTLLSAVVKHSNQFSFEFLTYVFEQNPDAVRVQDTVYKWTALRNACSNHPTEEIIRLLLRAYPEGAFVMGQSRLLPLHGLFFFADRCRLLKMKNSIQMVALANPSAIFTVAEIGGNFAHFAPFDSLLSKDFLNRYNETGASWRTEPEGSDHAITWSFLFLLMGIYRYGDKTNVTEALNPPQYPAHMAASCPCDSDLLVLMARLSSDHLLRYDNEGRSVLSLALESGHSIGVRHYCEEGCIRRLVEIDFRMLGLLDAKTQLYPFMTAACSQDRIVEMDILDSFYADSTRFGEETKEKIRANASLKCLNTIYFLLRADPSEAQRAGPK